MDFGFQCIRSVLFKLLPAGAFFRLRYYFTKTHPFLRIVNISLYVCVWVCVCVCERVIERERERERETGMSCCYAPVSLQSFLFQN
jgi:hypothetical protein